jgi:hypothetical protein
MAARVILDFFFIGGMQSDRAAFNIGLLQEGIISKKVDTEGISTTSIDAIWTLIAKTGKIDFLANMENDDIADQETYTTDFIKADLINGTTVEQSVRDYTLKFVVSDLGLKLARVMFGIGKVERGGTTEHFVTLLDLACYSGVAAGGSLTNNTDHGVTEWEIGLNTVLAQQIFKDIIGFERDWEQAVLKSKSWTFADISTWASSQLTEFNFVTSLMGIADNDSLRGLQSIYAFGTMGANGWQTAAVIEDTLDIITGDAFDEDTFEVMAWVYMFAQGQIEDQKRIHMPVEWSENEFLFLLRWGMLLSTDGDITSLNLGGIQERYAPTRIRLAEVREHKTGDRLCLTFANAVEVIRYKNLKDMENYHSTKWVHSLMLSDILPTGERRVQAARPAGFKDTVSAYIPSIGEQDNQRQWLRKTIPTSAGGGTKTTSMSPPTDDKPAPNEEGEGGDGEE